jgi:hypothetical protein
MNVNLHGMSGVAGQLPAASGANDSPKAKFFQLLLGIETKWNSGIVGMLFKEFKKLSIDEQMDVCTELIPGTDSALPEFLAQRLEQGKDCDIGRVFSEIGGKGFDAEIMMRIGARFIVAFVGNPNFSHLSFGDDITQKKLCTILGRTIRVIDGLSDEMKVQILTKRYCLTTLLKDVISRMREIETKQELFEFLSKLANGPADFQHRIFAGDCTCLLDVIRNPRITMYEFFTIIKMLNADVFRAVFANPDNLIVLEEIARRAKNSRGPSRVFEIIGRLNPDDQVSILTTKDAAFLKEILKQANGAENLIEIVMKLSPDVRRRVFTANYAAFSLAFVQNSAQNPKILQVFLAGIKQLEVDVQREILVTNYMGFTVKLTRSFMQDPETLKIFLEQIRDFPTSMQREMFLANDLALTCTIARHMPNELKRVFLDVVAELDRDTQEPILQESFLESLLENTGSGDDFQALVTRIFAGILPEDTIGKLLIASPEAQTLRQDIKKLELSMGKNDQYKGDGPLILRAQAGLRKLRFWTRMHVSASELEDCRRLYEDLQHHSSTCTDALRTGLEGFEIAFKLKQLGSSDATCKDQIKNLTLAWEIGERKSAIAMAAFSTAPGGSLPSIEVSAVFDSLDRRLRGLPNRGVNYPGQAKLQMAGINKRLEDDNPLVTPGTHFSDIIKLFREEDQYKRLLEPVRALCPLKYDEANPEWDIEFADIEPILILIIWRAMKNRDKFLGDLVSEGSLAEFASKVKKIPFSKFEEMPDCQADAAKYIKLAADIRQHLLTNSVALDVSAEEKSEIIDKLGDPHRTTLTDVSEIYTKYEVDVFDLEEEVSAPFGESTSAKSILDLTRRVALYEADIARGGLAM